MKRLLVLFISALFSAVLLCGWKTENTIALSEALKTGKVNAKLTGLGGHSGKCVSMTIENKSGKSTSFLLRAGEIMNSEDEGEQDLLVVHDQNIPLAAGQKKNVQLEGFCCQLHNASPGSGSGFKLGKQASDNLKKLCVWLKGKPIPYEVLQEAVWCLSDGNSPSNISVAEDSPQAEPVKQLRKRVCDLTKQADTWYSTPQQRILNEERQIESNPVEVFGDIEYTIKNTSSILGEVRNERNEVVIKMGEAQPLPAGTFTYFFHIKVLGYPKGHYHVLIKSGTEQIMDKEFVI